MKEDGLPNTITACDVSLNQERLENAASSSVYVSRGRYELLNMPELPVPPQIADYSIEMPVEEKCSLWHNISSDVPRTLTPPHMASRSDERHLGLREVFSR